jgi:hypothetical protein
MKSPHHFDPEVSTCKLLARRTQSSIAKWLSSDPKSHEGDPIIAIRQVLLVEPTQETRNATGGQDVILCGFEDCSVRIATIDAVQRRGASLQDMWSGEAIDDHMIGYREPYFDLAHDETYLRLANSDLPVMTEHFGSYIHLFHFAQGTLMISAADPARLIAPTFNDRTWQGGACTAIIPEAKSQHERITQAATLDKMNTHVDLLFAKTGNSGFTPRKIKLPA